MAANTDPMLDVIDGLRSELVAELSLTSLTQERVLAIFSAPDEASLRKALAVLAADVDIDGNGWDGYLTRELLKDYRYFDELSVEEFNAEAARGGF